MSTVVTGKLKTKNRNFIRTDHRSFISHIGITSIDILTAKERI